MTAGFVKKMTKKAWSCHGFAISFHYTLIINIL